MKGSKKYYKNMDLVRVIACIAILLYHLGILKGGYLAVCTFFVLSAYLSCVSAFKKEKFSLKDYYLNRLLHIYVPLLIVVFISIFAILFIPDINWFNLKPETTSILFGYNNFWQLKANLDYFAHHADSPFMHLWYMAILMQYDLIFPFIFMLLKKIGDKNKTIPCVITSLLAFIGTIYFYIMSLNDGMMVVYYHTLTRIFSLLFGLSLGFIHSYYKPSIIDKIKKKIIGPVIFYIYLIILICLFIFVGAESEYFNIAMILSTLVTLRLISYSTINVTKKLSIPDKLIKYLSGISYYVYLVQYPIIFLFQYTTLDSYLKITLIIVITLIISSILNYAILNKNAKSKVAKYIVGIIVLIISLCGLYQYVIAEDYTAEMNELEEQLNQNQEMMLEKQAEYAARMQEENENWESVLAALDNDEDSLRDYVTNLPVIGVGDSVMLGASTNIYETFPNAYVDAKVSRTDYEAPGILRGLSNNGMLGEPIVINLGANGGCPEACRTEIMNIVGDRKLFWLNVTNDAEVHMNARINTLASKYDNVYVIDWNNISKGHPEYFVADGIHLTSTGRKVFAETIYNSIYQVYLDEHNAKKEKLIQEHDDEMKQKITFYGNDILLNAFGYLKENFVDANFKINKDYNYESLKNDLIKAVNDETLTYKLVFAFDSAFNLTLDEYNELIELCKNHDIYMLLLNESVNLTNDNIKIIDFHQEIENNNYLMADKIHLTDEGNIALSEYLTKVLLDSNM